MSGNGPEADAAEARTEIVCVSRHWGRPGLAALLATSRKKIGLSRAQKDTGARTDIDHAGQAPWAVVWRRRVPVRSRWRPTHWVQINSAGADRHTRTQCAQAYTEGAPAQRPSKRQGKKQAGGRRRPSKACQGVSSAIVQTWSFFPFERLICRRNFWPFDAVFEDQCLIHSTQSDRNPQGINQVCINCPNHRAEFCVIK